VGKLIDEAGKRYGKLLVLSRAESTRHGVYWFCRCDCGGHKSVAGYNLRSGNVHTCGCSGIGVLIDETGNTYGRLTVLERAENSPRGQARWLCRCSCGALTVVRGNHLRNGNTKSCGCFHHDIIALPEGRAAARQVLRTYKRGAEKHTPLLSFDLTEEQFIALAQQSCYYCGTEPTQVMRGQDYHGTFTYNGIDRLNNDVGYTVENCVPCCKWCNYAKRERTLNEFLCWIGRVYNLWLQ
jgi:hypothetical protein